MIRVYEAENIIDAQLALDELRAGGLDAFIKGQHLTGGAGELPLNGVVSVWIGIDQHEQRALDIIQEYENAKRTEQPARLCTTCLEMIEGNFGRCWNCGKIIFD